MTETPFQGSLFAVDFLKETIKTLPDWASFDDSRLERLSAGLSEIFGRFPTAKNPNEAQTEDDLIWPVLQALGWSQSLRQQNLAAVGRDDVPDGLLFADEAAKSRANSFREEWKRYEIGVAIVESKRWARPLDRQSGKRGEETAPSTQMLRYLRRVEDLTSGALRWGVLTNGARWRLYFSGARSVSENFFEIDLARLLAVPGHDGGLFAPPDEERRHWLKIFALIFGRDAFVPTTGDGRTFHQRALDQGRFYEERVAASLSTLVFGHIFPTLAQAIAGAAPAAPLTDVRDAALVLLYRLLFILYAEDRNLLPVGEERYREYSLRDRVRLEVGKKLDRAEPLSESAARYWSVLDDLCRAIDQGDASIGLPPYNGGLFDARKTPLLAEVRIGDSVMARVIDDLSFEKTDTGRKYINYRDLSVQQLGSIYERLLEYQISRDGDAIKVTPNIFARKGSGSYYTPDDLVNLIIRESIDPLVSARMNAFVAKANELEASDKAQEVRNAFLVGLDPAEKLLEMKICDPAMGSGHFLVALVDYLADRVITAMADAQAEIGFYEYVSPLIARVDAIRATIVRNAGERGWSIDFNQLDDRHIVRRMVLKRCIYGVDKNVMAVELAKVSLWLHTFTVGAPLSFLDHHLRCGDSLFGSWVRQGIDRAEKLGAPLFLHSSLTKALRAASKMQIIEGLTDAEIAEAHRSKDVFDEVREMTAPLDAILSFLGALQWLDIKGKLDSIALQGFFAEQYGDPIALALGVAQPVYSGPRGRSAKDMVKKQADPRQVFDRFLAIWTAALSLIREERFFNWQVAFPGIWSDWERPTRTGGFDATIGNPPWDRMKLQQVEWFAARKPEIALAQRASERAKMIKALEKARDPLAAEYAKASERAETAVQRARQCGDYPLLSGGDVNLYSLFVERAMTIVKPAGMIGLLTPSGIASDKTAAPFFKGVATGGRLKALYDFENRRTRYDLPPFFPDVDSRFKFLAFIASPSRLNGAARCAFFLQDIAELRDPERCFPLTPQDFARVNPNTGTAPIFRTHRDAQLTTAIYDRLPVLVDRSKGEEVKAWPAKYLRMFDMTIDSSLFRTREELDEDEAAYPIGGNRFGSASGEYVPLYEGKMVQAFDHRAAAITINAENQHRPAQPAPTSLEEHQNPDWFPKPQFWIESSRIPTVSLPYLLAFKDVTAPTNMRSMIAAVIPSVGVGNTLPLILSELENGGEAAQTIPLFLANFNSTVFDFVARQKIQGQHLNWFTVEQLPVVPLDRYDSVHFGNKTARAIVREAVLELTYTAHDMAPFARDMGYVDEAGNVRPPFIWDEARRLKLRAKLDALYFHFYGVTDRDDVRYIFSTFPIVEQDEMEAFGRYRSRDFCLAYMNALAAGDPDADIDL
ncbi:MAG: restriction endonuclease [Alphaproteobacteria bacterium]|nr:restriction endonuclease [Alphaproteobacteria bacterium]